MENLYEILQSDPEASTEELRKAYTKLVRLHHPDKAAQHDNDKSPNRHLTGASEGGINGGASATDMFIKIDRAWKILSDPQLRAQFDSKWHEHCVTQDLPIQDTVNIQEFEYIDEDKVYIYPCRCGSDYLLTEIDFQLHFDIVCCETCSLTIKVLYDTT